MKTIFEKGQEAGFYIYGFKRPSENFLVEYWEAYFLEMDNIRISSDHYIRCYDDVNFLSYVALMGMFFDSTKYNFLLSAYDRDTFTENENRKKVNNTFELKLEMCTINDTHLRTPLVKGDFQSFENRFIKKVNSLQDLFSFDDTGNIGFTLIVSKDGGKDILYWQNFFDQEQKLVDLLDRIDYLVTLMSADDIGYMNAFNVYSKNEIDSLVNEIENIFLARISTFNNSIKKVKESLEFLNALEILLLGDTRRKQAIW